MKSYKSENVIDSHGYCGFRNPVQIYTNEPLLVGNNNAKHVSHPLHKSLLTLCQGSFNRRHTQENGHPFSRNVLGRSRTRLSSRDTQKGFLSRPKKASSKPINSRRHVNLIPRRPLARIIGSIRSVSGCFLPRKPFHDPHCLVMMFTSVSMNVTFIWTL